MRIANRDLMGIAVRDPRQFAPAEFEKHLRYLPVEVQQSYVLVAENLPSYVRSRLVARGIPFVVPGVQLNWPELGAALRQRGREKPFPLDRDHVSPATQAVVVAALINVLSGNVAVGEAAQLLGYTPMTMTRAFQELEDAGLGEVHRYGRERRLRLRHHGKALWGAALPRLRDPVRKVVRFRADDVRIGNPLPAGETALAEMSMLAAPVPPVYAVGPGGWRRLREAGIKAVPVDDVETCRLQVWSYEPSTLARQGRVDPFSLALSLRNSEDERVELAVKEMLEGFAW